MNFSENIYSTLKTLNYRKTLIERYTDFEGCRLTGRKIASSLINNNAGVKQ